MNQTLLDPTLDPTTLMKQTTPPLLIATFILLASRKKGIKMWFNTKFTFHRASGLTFLLLYSYSWYLLLMDYGYLQKSHIVSILAMNGLLQAVSALTTFTFLPSNESSKSNGYFSDKGILSREFVTENIFYQLLPIWGTFYFDEDLYRGLFRKNELTGLIFIMKLLEIVMIFLPFTLIRPFFPLTRLRDAYTQEKDKSKDNVQFYRIVIVMIKIFYIWSKHFMGFYLWYLRYLNLIGKEDLYWVHHMLLSNVGTVSIAMFLHTLRFKYIIGPRVAQIVYVMMAYQSFIGGLHLMPLFLSYPALFCMASFATMLNYWKRDLMNYYYVSAMVVVMLMDHQYIPLVKLDIFSS